MRNNSRKKSKAELDEFKQEVRRRARLQGHGRHDYYLSHLSYAIKETISKN